MKEQFADYETSKMLKELGMILLLSDTFAAWGEPEKGGGLYMGAFDTTALRAPLWQQAEEWLWDKHKIHVQVFKVHGSELFNFENRNTSFLDYPRYGGGFESPTTAHREGIKKAIEYIHSQTAVAVTPINTSANGA